MTHPTIDLKAGLGYQLSLAAKASSQPFEADLAEIGLSRQIWCILVAVQDQNKQTPSAIAQYLGLVRPAVSRSLRQMEHSGLIARTTNSNDKRMFSVSLTPKGAAAYQSARAFVEKTRQHFATTLTAAEQQQLSTLLQKLVTPQTTALFGI